MEVYISLVARGSIGAIMEVGSIVRMSFLSFDSDSYMQKCELTMNGLEGFHRIIELKYKSSVGRRKLNNAWLLAKYTGTNIYKSNHETC